MPAIALIAVIASQFTSGALATSSIGRSYAAIAWRADGGWKKDRLFQILAIIALITHTVIYLGSAVGYQPDSGGYVMNAIMIKDGFDFSGLGHTRTPGYPIFLSAIFALAGPNSTDILLLAQHALAIPAILAIYFIGIELFSDRVMAFASAFLSTFSLQTWSYANYPMTELLFTVLLIFAIYYMLRYVNTWQGRYLIIAMILIGITTNVRGTVSHFATLLALITIARIALDRAHILKRLKLLFASLALYAFFAFPWMAYNYMHHGFWGMSNYFGINLYSRVVEYEKTIDYDSPSIQKIREAFAEDLKTQAGTPHYEKMKQLGYMDYYYAPDSWKHHWPAFAAYRRATNSGLRETDEIMLKASIDCMKKYPDEYILNTYKYVYSLLTGAYEPTFLYLPAIPSGMEKTYPYAVMLDARGVNENIFAASLPAQAKDYLKPNIPKNSFSYYYAVIVNTYFTAITDKRMVITGLAFFIVGCSAFLLKSVAGSRRLVMFIYFSITMYLLVVPMLFVPGTVRMRLPADPLLTMIYVQGFISIVIAISGTLYTMIKRR